MGMLYFEGAGSFGTGGEVGNCRIRTAFTANDGKRYYVEIMGFENDARHRKAYPELSESEYLGIVSSCFEITGDHEDCNNHRNGFEGELIDYTEEGIRDAINERLGCSFQVVEVADRFSSYRAFGNGWDTFNNGDEYSPDYELIAEAHLVHGFWIKQQKSAGEKFPCVSVWWDTEHERLLHISNFGKRGLPSYQIQY